MDEHNLEEIKMKQHNGKKEEVSISDSKISCKAQEFEMNKG